MLGNFSLETTDTSKLLRGLSTHFAAYTKALAICIREAQIVGEIQSTHKSEHLAEFMLNSWEGAILQLIKMLGHSYSKRYSLA